MAKRKQPPSKTASKPKRAKTIDVDTTPSKASLLGIPGELRNRVYRTALLDAKGVRVTEQTCEEPGILRACRQTREEARPIYQKENKFVLIVHDMGAPTKPYWIWYSDIPQKNVYVTFCGRPIYENLRTWLSNYHHGIAKWMKGVDVDDGPDHWVMNKLFRIVDALKGVPWQKVDAVLDHAKDVGWSPGNDMWVELDPNGEEMISAY